MAGVGEGHTSGKRVSVYDTAEHLGITVDAIRKRIQRGTIAHERDEAGRVWVILDTTSKVHDADQDTYRTVGPAEFIEEMRERIQDLREQLAAERRANEENRRIIAALTRRIPELEAPAAPVTVTPGTERVEEEPERAEPHAATGGAQTVSEHRSVDDPPRLRWHVVGVILSMLASTFGDFLSSRLVPGYYPGSFLAYLNLSLLLLPLVVIPAFFGFRLGRKIRSRRFWQQLVAVGALIVLGNFLGYNVAQALKLLMIQAAGFFHNFPPYPFNVEGTIALSVPPGLIYISAAVLGNAIQRRNRERLMEQRPAGMPPESATAAQRWTPQQQAIVGLAGTILSALIGLIGTILTVMASGNGG